MHPHDELADEWYSRHDDEDDTHSPECEGARFGGSLRHSTDWPEMRLLNQQQRAAVLACPHRSHDSVRFLWMVKL